MYFLLVRRRLDGVAIPTKQLGKVQPLRADIHIGDYHSESLGRVATQAWVFNPTPGPDMIPRLHDAKVNGMAQLGMNINGVEDIDGVLYVQSWWCRVE
ncbi:hypothetical protein [Pseudomonas juntendi]|uniref:hypothetical protein n=1 Tax=Pseudomonas juntendi TaxID=2666183 RepID=UPI001F34CCD8|nr:hypothetical protein [Pseudomonas juntendi]